MQGLRKTKRLYIKEVYFDMERHIPKKTYRNIMNSLGGGTVPREGLGYIAVGREQEIDSLLRDTEIIQDGGATFRFVVGDYGSGKTFLLQTIKEYCVKNDFIVAEADLSPDRALIGNSTKKKGLATYRELMSNVSNKTNQSGRALTKVLESWVNNMFARAAAQMTQNPYGETNIEHIAETLMLEDCAKLQTLAYGYEFTMGLRLFWKASRTSDINEKMTGQENVLRWFRGEFKTNQESKKELGINAIVEDGNWFDYIVLWSQFFVLAGYKGFIILIDELAYICNTANSITRQNNYEKILMMYNAALQGKAEYLGIIMGGIPKSIYDKKRGIFSYEAMRSRLSTGSYQDPGIVNMMTPIIKVLPLTKEEMYVLLEKLAEIHAQLYEYEKVITEDEMIDFVKLAYMKRETTFITPRTMIRDFIQILDVKRQNPDKGIRDILSAYKFAVDEEQSYENVD